MIELANVMKNMQMCVTHSLCSQRQRTGPPCLTVTSALSGLIFFFFFNGVYALPFAFVYLWKHTEELNPNVALISYDKTRVRPSSLL